MTTVTLEYSFDKKNPLLVKGCLKNPYEDKVVYVMIYNTPFDFYDKCFTIVNKKGKMSKFVGPQKRRANPYEDADYWKKIDKGGELKFDKKLKDVKYKSGKPFKVNYNGKSVDLAFSLDMVDQKIQYQSHNLKIVVKS